MTKNNKIVAKLILLTLSLILIIFGIYTYNSNYEIYMYLQNNIDTEKLNSLISNIDSNATIYIGRKTCPSCINLFPKSKQIFKNEKKNVYYYNTDKNRMEKLFLSAMEGLGIDGVPTILIIENGNIKKVLDSQKIKEY
jgi:hypothetical protein